MTPEGYQILADALTADPETADFKVHPVPQSGEDIRDFEITIPGTKGEPIFRALAKAGLNHYSNPPNPDPNAPKLAFTSLAELLQTDNTKTLGFTDLKVK